jgi:hypothetical protein
LDFLFRHSGVRGNPGRLSNFLFLFPFLTSEEPS